MVKAFECSRPWIKRYTLSVEQNLIAGNDAAERFWRRLLGPAHQEARHGGSSRILLRGNFGQAALKQADISAE